MLPAGMLLSTGLFGWVAGISSSLLSIDVIGTASCVPAGTSSGVEGRGRLIPRLSSFGSITVAGSPLFLKLDIPVIKNLYKLLFSERQKATRQVSSSQYFFFARNADYEFTKMVTANLGELTTEQSSDFFSRINQYVITL